MQLASEESTAVSVHGVGSNESPPEEDEKPTVPLGVLTMPSVSVTVAVHVVPTATSTELAEHEIEVLVLDTVSVVEPLLVAWVASPL